MKSKRAKILICIAIAMLAAGFTYASYAVGNKVFEASTQLVTNAETAQVKASFWERVEMDYDEFTEQYTVEKIEIASSFDEHVLPADYIYQPGADDKDRDTVILAHGLGGNRYTNYPMAEYFLGKGYNVITYDQRSSGENTAPYTTFGYLERHDIVDLVAYVRENAPDKRIGLWGTSFGGATVGLALEIPFVDQNVAFAIFDCPVSSMKDMLAAEIAKLDTPLPTSYMLMCGNFVNRAKLGFSYEDAEVCRAIADTQVPVLIVNSQADTRTPVYMGCDIYEAVESDRKMLWTVEDSKHAKIWLNHREEYKQKIEQFLNEFGGI